MSKIITEHSVKPIPLRAFDWNAVRDGYEPGDAIGNGSTEAAAIASLKEQEESESNDSPELIALRSFAAAFDLWRTGHARLHEVDAAYDAAMDAVHATGDTRAHRGAAEIFNPNRTKKAGEV